MVRISVVHYSGRGHTAEIAKHVIMGAQSVDGVEVLEFTMDNVCTKELTTVDAIVFGCPTYFGSAPADYKKFMDSTSQIWQEGLWKNKIAAAFSDSSCLSGDKLSTISQLNLFAMQHGMIWVGLDLPPNSGESGDLNRIGSWLGLMSQSTSKLPIEESPPRSDKNTAFYFGERIANITKIFHQGKK